MARKKIWIGNKKKYTRNRYSFGKSWEEGGRYYCYVYFGKKKPTEKQVSKFNYDKYQWKDKYIDRQTARKKKRIHQRKSQVIRARNTFRQNKARKHRRQGMRQEYEYHATREFQAKNR